MTSIDEKLDGSPYPGGDVRLPTEPFWRRLLRRLAKAAIPLSAAQGGATREPDSDLPVYRITRAPHDCWMAQRPGSTLEHAFDDGGSAEDFVRHECSGSAAMVVLRINALYIAARIDRTAPRLFRGCDRDRPLPT